MTQDRSILIEEPNTLREMADLGLPAFTRRWFGRYSYQATANYHYWLYKASPEDTPGPLVATSDGRTVGVIHRMTVPLADGLVGRVAHNLVVDPDVRSGLGFVMVKRVMRGSDITVIPGVSGPFADIYPALRAKPVTVRWLRKALWPPRPSLRALDWPQAILRPGGLRQLSKKIDGIAIGNEWRCISEPSDEFLGALASQLNARRGVITHWSPETLRWRLHHFYGPQSLHIQHGADSELIVTVAFGLAQRGKLVVPTARLLHQSEASESVRLRQLRATVSLLQRLGVAIVFGAFSETNAIATLQSAGFEDAPVQPRSFVLGPMVKAMTDEVTFDPLASDVGFEGIARDPIWRGRSSWVP